MDDFVAALSLALGVVVVFAIRLNCRRCKRRKARLEAKAVRAAGERWTQEETPRPWTDGLNRS